MITVVITETSPGHYLAAFGDRILVERSRTPLFCAARRLLSEGVPPDALLAMRRSTGPVAMTGRVGALAGLTVHEAEGVRFVRLTPAEKPSATPFQARQRPEAHEPLPAVPANTTPIRKPENDHRP